MNYAQFEISSWNVVPANESDLARWSYGEIKMAEDLYAARIFGANRNLVCECGNVAGLENVGNVCVNCKTSVEVDASVARRCRIGVFKAGFVFRHPVSKEFVSQVAVPPIFYRTSGESPNNLGLKFDRLFQMKTHSSTQHLQTAGFGIPSIDRLRVVFEALYLEILGFNISNDGRLKWNGDQESVYGEVLVALPNYDTSLRSLARCCGFAFEARARS